MFQEQKTPKPTGKCLEMCVYLMDKSGVQFSVEDGRNAVAAEILEILEEEADLPEITNSLFALWLVSPLLEIQLKPHHSPFRLTVQWDELLARYSTADLDEVERDEPVLTLRRRVSLPRNFEKEQNDPKIEKLLYHEACYNIVEGRYPLNIDDYDKLAGLQVTIDHGLYNAEIHDEKFYDGYVDDCFPDHMCKRPWSLPGCRSKSTPELRLMRQHIETSQKCGSNSDEAVRMLILEYLQVCWELPYYGSAFFPGQIEKPMNAFIANFKENSDIDVIIAINREGIFVIDKVKVTILLGLLYNEFSWDLVQPGDQANDHCIPCLFLQFRDVGEGGLLKSRTTKLLQIFSRQARMMDALIESCVSQCMSGGQRLDNIDGGEPYIPESISCTLMPSSSCMSNKLDRLTLATLTPEGQPLSGSHVFRTEDL